MFSDVSFWDSLPTILVSKEMLRYFPHRLLTGDELTKAQSFSRLRKKQSEVPPDLDPGESHGNLMPSKQMLLLAKLVTLKPNHEALSELTSMIGEES